MSNSTLTYNEAFLAMYLFLEEYYRLTKSDDIGALLGSMSLLKDGGTADPAIESDWINAVERAIKGEIRAELVLHK